METKFCVLLAFILTVTSCFGVAIKEPYVQGGEIADDGKYPSQMSVWPNGAPMCAGSLISSEYVLTTASCLLLHGDIIMIKVMLGVQYLLDGEYTSCYDYFIHPDYDADTHRNDIAVIKLPEPVTFSSTLAPIQLARTEPDVKEPVHIVGWGGHKDFHSPTNDLMETRVKVISDRRCRRSYGSLGLAYDFDSLVCTSTGADGKGACYDDLGAALIVNANKVSKPQELVGVATTFRDEDCGVKIPTIFTSVSAHLGWISEVTGIEL